jgi:ferredoxin
VNETERRWDSCFDGDFARVAGGNFRPRRQDRYRQWLTHKFATWHDQFGTSGCVGCGRCITWCPVGIDVREELAAIAPPYAGPVSVVAPSMAAPSRTTRTRAPLPILGASAPATRENGWTVGTTPATVRATAPETADTTTLWVVPADDALLASRPGQFVMVEQPGFSPVPISVSRVADGARRRPPRSRRPSPARRSHCAGPSGAHGRSTARWAATSSSSPAGSGWRRSVRSSTRSDADATASATCSSPTARGRPPTGCT